MKQVVPKFEVDPFWPKPLPEDWVIGQVAGLAVDSYDNVWIAHRPGSLDEAELGAIQHPQRSECCVAAPPVLCFDPSGEVIHAFGGIGKITPWMSSEHGVYVDKSDNVWVASNGADDHIALKLTMSGEVQLVIGELGRTGGSNDERLLGRTADIFVEETDNEVYFADGYLNRRVIVFDANTGAYKRHWGGYGERPTDAPLSPFDPTQPPIRSFGNPVHSVVIANDGLVYVADRINNRIQVFQKDGTYVTEGFVRRETRGNGSTHDLELSKDPDQTFLYVADGTNFKVWIVERKSLEVVGSFGRLGRMAGQFEWIHNVAGDSKGNLYTSEVHHGKRVQKFNIVQ